MIHPTRSRERRQPERGDKTISNVENPSPEAISRIVLGVLEDKKAINIRTLHVVASTILADYFIICTADNIRQSKALSEAVRRELRDHGLRPLGIEGTEDGLWVLLDFGSVVVHIMMPDARAYYDLDNYWGDCPEVALEPIVPRAA